jgi:hypothetical protein
MAIEKKQPSATYLADIRMAILEDPCEFVVVHETLERGDRMMGKSNETTFGPFWGNFAEFRQTRVYGAYDEKGSTAAHGFVLVALRELRDNDGEIHTIPEQIGPQPKASRMFKLNAYIYIDGRPLKYRITSVPEDGAVIEINIELEQ